MLAYRRASAWLASPSGETLSTSQVPFSRAESGGGGQLRRKASTPAANASRTTGKVTDRRDMAASGVCGAARAPEQGILPSRCADSHGGAAGLASGWSESVE